LADAAEGGGDIHVLSALDQHEQDEQDADQNVKRCYGYNHSTSFGSCQGGASIALFGSRGDYAISTTQPWNSSLLLNTGAYPRG
jgi:hypothetical protein